MESITIKQIEQILLENDVNLDILKVVGVSYSVYGKYLSIIIKDKSAQSEKYVLQIAKMSIKQILQKELLERFGFNGCVIVNFLRGGLTIKQLETDFKIKELKQRNLKYNYINK